MRRLFARLLLKMQIVHPGRSYEMPEMLPLRRNAHDAKEF